MPDDTELWTMDQVAEHLGIKPKSASGLLSRRGVVRVDLIDHPVSKRPQARFRAAEVRAIAEDRRPGRRTDRTA